LKINWIAAGFLLTLFIAVTTGLLAVDRTRGKTAALKAEFEKETTSIAGTLKQAVATSRDERALIQKQISRHAEAMIEQRVILENQGKLAVQTQDAVARLNTLQQTNQETLVGIEVTLGHMQKDIEGIKRNGSHAP